MNRKTLTLVCALSQLLTMWLLSINWLNILYITNWTLWSFGSAAPLELPWRESSSDSSFFQPTAHLFSTYRLWSSQVSSNQVERFVPWSPQSLCSFSNSLPTLFTYLGSLQLHHCSLDAPRVKNDLVKLINHLLVECHQEGLLWYLLFQTIVAPMKIKLGQHTFFALRRQWLPLWIYWPTSVV